EVRDDPERLCRQRDSDCVALDDVDEATAQPGRQRRVELDCSHARARARECNGEETGSGAEVENEVAGPDPGRANELRCERATAEEVLAAGPRLRRSRAHGHGGRPTSSLP